jgi:hypothetical protein
MIKRKKSSTENKSLGELTSYMFNSGGEPGKDVVDWVKAERELNSAVVIEPAKKKAALSVHA